MEWRILGLMSLMVFLVAGSWPLWYLSRLRQMFVGAEILIAGLFSAVVIWLFIVG